MTLCQLINVQHHIRQNANIFILYLTSLWQSQQCLPRVRAEGEGGDGEEDEQQPAHDRHRLLRDARGQHAPTNHRQSSAEGVTYKTTQNDTKHVFAGSQCDSCDLRSIT